MNALADAYAAELQSTFRDSGITWKRIDGRPYSQGANLSTLYEQTRAARAWLDGSPQGTPSISLNLHSDAPGANTPGVSHVGARVDSRGTHAEAITKLICPAIAVVFNTTRIMYFDGTDYVFAKELASSPHIPLLIEHGDHTVAADNLTLHTKGREIARSSIGAILAYYGLPVPSPGPENHPEIVAYLAAHPELGTARIGSNLTYRDGAGDWVCKTTTGAWVIWREYTRTIGVEDWQPPEIITVPVYPDAEAMRTILGRLASNLEELRVLTGV